MTAPPSWLSNNMAGREGERVPEGSAPSNTRTGRGEEGRGREGGRAGRAKVRRSQEREVSAGWWGDHGLERVSAERLRATTQS